MKKLSLKPFALFLLLNGIIINPFQVLAQSSAPSIYVWEFTTSLGQKTEATRALTEEFEELLIQSECCTVLQRRHYARLFEQKQNEKAVINLESIPVSTIDGLKALEANSVAFGEVHHDQNSGLVRISFTVESFDGRIIDKGSGHMPLYDLVNPFKRKEKTREIMASMPLVEVSEDAVSRPNTAEIAKPVTEEPIVKANFQNVKEQENIKYELIESVHPGSEYQVWLLATNNGADETLCMRYNSYLVDSGGNSHKVSARMSGSNRGGLDCFWFKAPNGVPVRFGLAFKSLPPAAKTIPMLEIVLHQRTNLQFRDIPVPYKK